MPQNKNDLVNEDVELLNKALCNEEDETLPMDYSTKTRKLNDETFKILLDRNKEDTNGKETDNGIAAKTNTTSNEVSIVGCTTPPINRVIRKVETLISIFQPFILLIKQYKYTIKIPLKQFH